MDLVVCLGFRVQKENEEKEEVEVRQVHKVFKANEAHQEREDCPVQMELQAPKVT